MFLRQVGDACGSLEVGPALHLAERHTYSSPRGLMRMHGNLVNQDVYIAAADGLRFETRGRSRTPHDSPTTRTARHGHGREIFDAIDGGPAPG